MLVNTEAEIEDKGFKVISVPVALAQTLKDHIVKHLLSLGKSDVQDFNHVVKALSDQEFRQLFTKPKRFFPLDVCQDVIRWAGSLKEFVLFDEYVINLVGQPAQGSKEDNAWVGYEDLPEEQYDIFWRCVRPNKEDVGSPHRDSDFWARDEKYGVIQRIPIDYTQRWKVWIPLFGCNLENSLRVVEGSHREDVPVEFIEKSAGLKPCIGQEWLVENEDKFFCPFDAFEGRAILFHDDLVHKGPPNTGELLRISAEFTILCK